MIDIRRCSIDEITADPALPEILAGYAKDSAIPELGDPTPSMELYRAMEAAGALKAIGVFVDGRLVGLATLLIYGLPHYAGRIIANVESVYVLPAHRPGGTGALLLQAIERFAAEAGSPVLTMSATAGSRLEVILPRSGYRQTNTAFLKALP